MSTPEEHPIEEIAPSEILPPQLSFLRRWWVGLLGIALVLSLIACAVLLREEFSNFRSYGYVGAFLISILAGSTVIIPVPGDAVIFALGGMSQSILNPLFVGLAAGLGEAIGVLSSYLAGWGGHTALKNRQVRFYSRVESWVKKRGSLVIFLASSVLNPFFILFGIAAGALRFPPWKFFLLCWAGKTVKDTYIAFLGWWGLGFIFSWLGIKL